VDLNAKELAEEMSNMFLRGVLHPAKKRKILRANA
jgi:hypothetical protein